MRRTARPRQPHSRPGPPSHIRHNRRVWDHVSGWYDRKFAKVLGGRSARAWGVWRTPEDDLRLLGAVRGRRILELGCGAARWSIALAHQGARPVGLDLSQAQLNRARQLARKGRVRLPLVRGNAERLPFGSSRFDLVFSDWGATTFSDPLRWVPECARVLRRNGRLVFAAPSPFGLVSWDERSNRLGRRLRQDYFGQHRFEFGPKDAVEFRLSYGDWIALFRKSGFTIERLIESQPGPRTESAYLSKSVSAWARRWPFECLWQLRKAGRVDR